MPLEMKCVVCEGQFLAYPSEIEGGRKYCSLACRSADRFGTGIPASSTPVHFTCKECNKPFIMMQSYLTAYRKKFDKDPLYCSRDCSDVGRKKDTEARSTFTCAQCGNTFSKRRKPGGQIYAQQKFCSHACKAESQRTNALEKFNAGSYGRHIKRHGYVWISVPSLVTGKKHAVMEHRYVMSKHLGRPLLPEETVHHINGIRSDNRPENLELFSDRHGPGQRVTDKVAFGIEMINLYPEVAAQLGFMLVPIKQD